VAAALAADSTISTKEGRVPDDAQAVVEKFFDKLGTTTDENVDAFVQYMREDFVWDTGSRVLHSRDESIAHLRNLSTEYGVIAFRANVVNIAGEGRIVLTERVDDLIAPDGSVIVGVKVMGTFEVEDERIVAWRDYYDTARLAR
jgi:limonene-1,2-epoxide hydrolase